MHEQYERAQKLQVANKIFYNKNTNFFAVKSVTLLLNSKMTGTDFTTQKLGSNSDYTN